MEQGAQDPSGLIALLLDPFFRRAQSSHGHVDDIPRVDQHVESLLFRSHRKIGRQEGPMDGPADQCGKTYGVRSKRADGDILWNAQTVKFQQLSGDVVRSAAKR